MAVRCQYRVPRSFKLLDELENAEKGKYAKNPKYANHAPFISLGLAKMDDRELTEWNASIIPAQGTHIGERIYSLKIRCGSEYPERPPEVRFQQVVAIPGVNGRGVVGAVPGLAWSRESCVFDVLVSLREALKRYSAQCAKVSGEYR